MTKQLTQHPAFEAPLSYGQFSKNGDWENAWKFTGDGIPKYETIADYLQKSEEVAFEAFFGHAFFGLRFRGTANDVRCGAVACVKAYASKSSENSFFSRLSNYLKTPLWGTEVLFAEIGAVNFWKSVGPYRVPDLEQARIDPSLVLKDLASTPVGLNTDYPKALEIACDGSIAHWFGLPISSQTAPYAISPALLASALACT